MALKNINSTKPNKIGQIFTPSFIAEFMVKNISSFIINSGRNTQKLRVLESSAGIGVFLKFLLKNNFSNITAYEMDLNLKKHLLESYSNVIFKFENFLGSDPNEKFDIIIGNPPYLGQNYNAKIFKDYVEKFPICAKYFVGNMDLFYYFIHLGIEKLNPGGLLSFITTNYWITKSKKTGIKYLKPHVLEECFLLQYINLANLNLFEGVKGQHNCIFVLKKKNEKEKIQQINKNIEIIQVFGKKDCNQKNESFNEKIFRELTYGNDSSYIERFTSALTNNDLKKERNWNIIYPKEHHLVLQKIEKFCKVDNKISFLNDYFLIRNGLILIKDSIFILHENEDLKVKNDDFYIKIDGNFVKLHEVEKLCLKKVYKSKSIKSYGYTHDDYEGYLIYFNKNKFKSYSIEERNHIIKKRYPILSKYLEQFEKELREILINAKENPEDFYFPRRGSFIRKFEDITKEKLIDLEPLYDNGKKIFFKFISNKNIFGYSNTSYYATSDTYFLWPKFSDKKIDYLFILAYLNSKLVYSLFKAKNITIKRSKTKLEYGLPIPNLENFISKIDKSRVELIKFLTSFLIEINSPKWCGSINRFYTQLLKLNYFYLIKNEQLKLNLQKAIMNIDRKTIQNYIDKIIFQLFDIDETMITYLLNKYYKS